MIIHDNLIKILNPKSARVGMKVMGITDIIIEELQHEKSIDMTEYFRGMEYEDFTGIIVAKEDGIILVKRDDNVRGGGDNGEYVCEEEIDYYYFDDEGMVYIIKHTLKDIVEKTY